MIRVVAGPGMLACSTQQRLVDPSPQMTPCMLGLERSEAAVVAVAVACKQKSKAWLHTGDEGASGVSAWGNACLPVHDRAVHTACIR